MVKYLNGGQSNTVDIKCRLYETDKSSSTILVRTRISCFSFLLQIFYIFQNEKNLNDLFESN